MIHFEHPSLLYLLLIVPVATGIYLWLMFRHQRRMNEYADKSLHDSLLPEASRRRLLLKFSLHMLALGLLIITVANPQIGTKMLKGERLGSDISICLDVSRSMMAEDVSPNRLKRSQNTVNTLLDKLGSDKVSLVIFAGSSFIQMPLTNDYNAARMYVDQTSCDLIEAQGTAIGDAIGTAMASLGYNDPEREWKKRLSRAIIIISDGENFEDDAVTAAHEASKEGVTVCCIGMGTTKGTPIPEYRNGKNIGYKHDNNGSIVTTMLDEQTLINVAKAGNGIYVRTNNINAGIEEILQRLQKLEKDNYGSVLFSEYESRYQYPLVLALLCLITELLLFEKKNKQIQLGKFLHRP